MSYIDDALAKYGATYDHEAKRIVTRDGLPTRTTIKETSRRLEMRSVPEGRLIMSGGKSESTVCAFVEKFWYWEPIS